MSHPRLPHLQQLVIEDPRPTVGTGIPLHRSEGSYHWRKWSTIKTLVMIIFALALMAQIGTLAYYGEKYKSLADRADKLIIDTRVMMTKIETQMEAFMGP